MPKNEQLATQNSPSQALRRATPSPPSDPASKSSESDFESRCGGLDPPPLPPKHDRLDVSRGAVETCAFQDHVALASLSRRIRTFSRSSSRSLRTGYASTIFLSTSITTEVNRIACRSISSSAMVRSTRPKCYATAIRTCFPFAFLNM